MTDLAPPSIDTSAETNKMVESPIPSATAPPVPVPSTFNKDIGIDTPPPSTKPVQAAPIKQTETSSPINPTRASKPFCYTSPKINFEDDAPTYLKTKAESLIYWEYPKKSAAFLVGTLGILVLTQYYSLLQILAGVFTLVTGLNLIFVNTHKQGQRFIGGKSTENIANPHSQRLETKGSYIPRDRVLRTAQLTVDVVEVITQQITKLVLIEDNWKSVISLIVSYLVWTLAKFVSTKYLVGIFALSAFSVPRLYLQNKDLVDGHAAAQTKNARVLAEKYGGVAYEKAKELTEQTRSFIKSKTSGATAATPGVSASGAIPSQEPKKTE
ncbi:Reticulon-domain-containing protein [Helicostylum pulchrum]|uniref:Reticulon-like protein n=1 Tax=Helicostylum pulchrum TaxID=562976 RepID=A0ABP9Y6S2_9FUNG|nr:Reticulon-domain-containing protein [Helicostylum pulchrum]